MAFAELEKADSLPLGPLPTSVLFIWGAMKNSWTSFASGSKYNIKMQCFSNGTKQNKTHVQKTESTMNQGFSGGHRVYG